MLNVNRKCQLIAAALLTVAAAFSAGGCVTVDQEVVLKGDTSGSSILKVCIDQEVYRDESYRAEYEPLIWTVFDNLDDSPGTTVQSREEKDYEGVHCYEASHEFGNVNEFGGNSINFSYGTEDNQKVLRSKVLVWDDVTQDQWAQFKGGKKADNSRLRFRLTFPYPVTEAIGGTINGMSAVWDVPLSQFTESPMRGMGMTAKAPVRSFSIEGTYKIEGGKSNIRLK
jgi:hypothetical protein